MKHCWPSCACLNPFTPACQLHPGQELKGEGDIDNAPWPAADESAMVENTTLVVVQVNGKVRGKLPSPLMQPKSRFVSVLAGTSGGEIS